MFSNVPHFPGTVCIKSSPVLFLYLKHFFQVTYSNGSHSDYYARQIPPSHSFSSISLSSLFLRLCCLLLGGMSRVCGPAFSS
jgi:hypothetical protein